MTTAIKPTDLQALKGILAAKNIFLAGYTILLYDYLTQLPEEVAQIWKKNNTVAKGYLFLRYYSIIAPTFITFGYFDPWVSGNRCLHWMLFIPFGLIIPLGIMSGTLMAMRIYAMYGRPKALLVLLTLSLITQAGLGLWIWSTPGATFTPDPVNNYEFHYCIFIPSKTLGAHNPSVYAFMELSFDALCFLLTLIRPFWGASGIRHWGKSLWVNLAANGALYFGVIFSVNLGWAIMILHAPSSIRGSLAAPSTMAMATFICRITLSLRYAVYGSNVDETTRLAALNAKAVSDGTAGDDVYPLEQLSGKRRQNPHPYSPSTEVDTHYLEGVDYGHGRGERYYSGTFDGYGGSGYGGSSGITTGTGQTLIGSQSPGSPVGGGINVEQSVVILRE